MSEDRVLGALNRSESAKKNTKRIWIAPNQQKMKIMMLIKHLKKQVNKTIREIRKEN